ncbi:MAG: GTP cyclohydrolase I FolE [Salibacteraceae bacterium]|jgi:GTP cyclohydrolase IA|nr:GTP cyclohydrolase I FolE [Salibacteraceae bacterium]MDP4687041.1 GTP cyclohydrolase I FolE [Salibacteraceae bacterium]MDP4763549.1 GTP cyclohydrolase I FolE [Salibacteraceae bacterium]MDP4842978.1 GTP cyclohydrolase I FolE [Salibacteraceae bacterium]MDP4963581.1 GTP cyclohydrolase I FolE [Salibacteraceae bacterium]
MKPNETLLNTAENNRALLEALDYEHNWNGLSTPMRQNAHELSATEKIEKIKGHFKEIMETLGMDLTDESLQDTPKRVAKMFVNEVFKGLNPDNKPEIKLFENKFKYKEMLVERDITLYSYCEHHFVPIIGKAHVAYISNGHVIGLSKINRLVEFYAKRPQVQERLNEQIAKALKEVLKTDDVAVVIDAEHLCVKSRGIQDTASSTVTASYHGKFKETEVRKEFLTYLNLKANY